MVDIVSCVFLYCFTSVLKVSLDSKSPVELVQSGTILELLQDSLRAKKSTKKKMV